MSHTDSNEVTFDHRIFPPAKDAELLALMEKADQIAIAAAQAKGAPEEWTEKEVTQAVNWATSRWAGQYGHATQATRKEFQEHAVAKGLPTRPAIYGSHAIPQLGIGKA